VLSPAPSVWLLSQVSFEGSSEAAPAPLTVGPVALAVVSSAAVGALLAGRRPRHPVGWLLLVGGYAAVVLGLGQLLGRDSSLVVAAATLAVAGLFQPARRRVQELVDRRFNRRRHWRGRRPDQPRRCLRSRATGRLGR
jgi:hypothetical protein